LHYSCFTGLLFVAMTSLILFTCLPLVGLALLGAAPARAQAPCEVHLLVREQGTLLTVVGQCLNTSTQPLSLRYELKTDKNGPSGTARNSQSGRFTVAPQQRVTLSQQTLSVGAADSYQLQLRALDEQGRVVAQDSLVHAPARRP
jgi:hypothetical protein